MIARAKTLGVINYASTTAAFVGIAVAAASALCLVWGAGGKETELFWRIFGTGIVLFAGGAGALCTAKFFHLNRAASSAGAPSLPAEPVRRS